MRSARTATIGRFEATLVRDRPSETVAKSGVRALDWREAVHVPIEPGMVEWKLYLRLFDDIDGEFEGHADTGFRASACPSCASTLIRGPRSRPARRSDDGA